MKYCSSCKKELPLENFSWKNKKQNLKQSFCKSCTLKYNKTYYRSNKKKFYDLNLNRKRKHRELIKSYKIERGCKVCGYKKCADALTFHHLKDKKIDLSRAQSLSWKLILKEIEKCIVLCANCHAEEHSKRN